jgi:hypothetical protein
MLPVNSMSSITTADADEELLDRLLSLELDKLDSELLLELLDDELSSPRSTTNSNTSAADISSSVVMRIEPSGNHVTCQLLVPPCCCSAILS